MNRLGNETSPYLRQHADNPVDWYPWGEEALSAAKSSKKPILLSIGYSACHWCHVMAHESFEHEPTAQIMNQFFINIKVDREERPDVDDIYMGAVQAMNNGQGGWPLTVFLLPDGRPFYGGTYFPLERKYGMPSFRDVLHGVYDAYINRREEVEQQAEQLTQGLSRDVLNIGGQDSDFTPSLLEKATQGILRNFDTVHGGFGTQPKFPQPMTLEFLLRGYLHTQDEDTLHAVTHTLTQMARGGIYDQIGGGFARYSVDAEWLVPHFEKMLYDNAQLSRLYLRAWQVTKNPFFKHIAEEIYDYILREMSAPEGGFYSATDADSEGEEGKFFVWSLDKVKEALTPLDIPNVADIAIAYFGMREGGNFEGHNILFAPDEPQTIADQFGLSLTELNAIINQIKDRLYAHRSSRVHPGLDDKILTSWNGLMLASLAEAARVLNRDDYRTAAERTGNFLLQNMTQLDGALWRTHNQGVSKINAVLEDYANLIDAYVELYQLTFIETWFVKARRLADYVLDHFRADDGGFYDTSNTHEQLIVRPRNLQDNAIPSGNSMIAKQLLRLAAYTGDERYDSAAQEVLRKIVVAVQQYPQAFGEALNAIDHLITGISEVAIVGNPVQEDTQEILQTLQQQFYPNLITALAREDQDEDATIPLLQYRVKRNDQATVYVCRNFACAFPVNTAQEMVELLQTDPV